MFCFFRRLRLAIKLLEDIMAQIDDLNAAVAKLQADVSTLIAATPPAVDLTATIAAVNAVDATVVAATPAPTP